MLASVHRRDGIPRLYGAGLWHHYVLSAVSGAAGLPVVCLHFEDLVRSPVATIERLADDLRLLGVDLRGDATAAAGSLRDDLVHGNDHGAVVRRLTTSTVEVLGALPPRSEVFDPPSWREPRWVRPLLVAYRGPWAVRAHAGRPLRPDSHECGAAHDPESAHPGSTAPLGAPGRLGPRHAPQRDVGRHPARQRARTGDVSRGRHGPRTVEPAGPLREPLAHAPQQRAARADGTDMVVPTAGRRRLRGGHRRHHDHAGHGRRRVFRSVHRVTPWVWKDPRTCVLLPFWRHVLGPRLAAVIVFRNPLEVAESLQRRHGFTPSFGLALWERYNRLLLSHAAGLPVLVSRYDDLMTDADRWTEQVGGFLAGLGMAIGTPTVDGAVASFVDPGLRHSSHIARRDLRRLPRRPDRVRRARGGPGSDRVLRPASPPPEPPSVEQELRTLGPDRHPDWHPPPWAGGAGTAPAPPAGEG